MPIHAKYFADFEEGCIYHVYNRTSNKELLYKTDDNRAFFLKRYATILSPYIDTYCWCLLPNHFHLLVKVKSIDPIRAVLLAKLPNKLTATEKGFLENKVSLSELIEQGFKRFFQSYALAFNKVHNRQGNLFYKPFKRIKINKETQFTITVIYIHANAVKHRLVKDFTLYPWSSWHTVLSNMPTMLARKELVAWFGGLEQFIKTHKELALHYYNSEVSIEE